MQLDDLEAVEVLFRGLRVLCAAAFVVVVVIVVVVVEVRTHSEDIVASLTSDLRRCATCVASRRSSLACLGLAGLLWGVREQKQLGH